MAVTVTYQHPITGLVAPTAAQVADMVIATIIKTLDADVAATITHNFGLTAAQLAAGFPVIDITPILQVDAKLSDFTVNARGANDVSFIMTAAVGSGNAAPQVRVTIERPHSIGR